MPGVTKTTGLVPGDIGVAELGRRLVETERGDAGKIEPGHGLPDIVLDDTPQPLVGDADDAGAVEVAEVEHSLASVKQFVERAQVAEMSLRPHLTAGSEDALILIERPKFSGEPRNNQIIVLFILDFLRLMIMSYKA